MCEEKLTSTLIDLCKYRIIERENKISQKFIDIKINYSTILKMHTFECKTLYLRKEKETGITNLQDFSEIGDFSSSVF